MNKFCSQIVDEVLLETKIRDAMYYSGMGTKLLGVEHVGCISSQCEVHKRKVNGKLTK